MLAAPDLVWLGCRALQIAAVLQSVGIAIFMRLFGESRAVARLGVWAAASGIVLTLALQLLGPTRMTASFDGVLDLSLQVLYWRSDAGLAHTVRAIGLALVILAMGTPPKRLPLDLLGAAMVVVSFALMGHTVTHEPRWVLGSLLLIHVAVIAFWFGALLPLRSLTREPPWQPAADVIGEFSRLAAWTVPLILAAGVGLAIVLLGTLAELFHPYGLLILAKSALFAVLLGLASLNKWRLAPAIGAGDPAAIAGFRRTTLAEWALILVVVCLTVIMTGVFSP